MAKKIVPYDLKETNGVLYVKFYFTNKGMIPYGIPKWKDRDAFKVVDGKRQDTGKLVFDYPQVGAQLLRVGLGNADGHGWKLTNIGWFEKTITNSTAREEIGDGKQCVVQLTYELEPDEDKIWVLTRQIRTILSILANGYSWAFKQYHNDGSATTLNFTSPREVDPMFLVVVSQGALTIERNVVTVPEAKTA